MKIGFALNEILALLTLLTSGLSLAWWRLRRAGAVRKPWWVSWGPDVFMVVMLIFSCRVAVADWQRVPTGSMEPTLRVGDLLLINHLAYGPRLPFTNTALKLGDPQRGDIAVFRYPLDVSTFYVKRIVAVGGDRVAFRDGVVAVNGETAQIVDLGWGEHAADRGQRLLVERSAGRERAIKLNPFVLGRMPLSIGSPDCAQERPGHWDCTVPPGKVLALGDNRDNSADSRAWGFLDERELYGRVDRVLLNTREGSRFWHKPS